MLKRVLLWSFILCMAVVLSGCQLSPYQQVAPAPTNSPTPPLAQLPGELASLSFSESASYFKRVQSYEFCADGSKYTAYFWMANEEEPYPMPVDQAWVDALTAIVRQNNMLLWDGFRGNCDALLDGTHFSISFAFADGATVCASGYGSFPEDYGAATAELEAHFMQLLPEDMRDW